MVRAKRECVIESGKINSINDPHVKAAIQALKDWGDHEVSDYLTAVLEHELGRKTYPSELLDTPITYIDLSVRADQCLERAQVQTVLELVQKTETELLAISGFGRTTLREVKRKLDEYGLRLGMSLIELGLKEEG